MLQNQFKTHPYLYFQDVENQKLGVLTMVKRLMAKSGMDWIYGAEKDLLAKKKTE